MPSASLAKPHPVDRRTAWLSDLLDALPAPAGAQAARQALARAELAGAHLPDRHQEAWRFTSLAALKALDPASLVRPPAQAAAPPLGANWPPAATEALRLVVDDQADPLASEIGRAHV